MVAGGQTTVPQRYRIISAQAWPKLLEAINSAAAQHYRRVLFAGGAMLMESIDGSDPFKYLLVSRESDREIRKQLNGAGARGYRVVDAVDRTSFPTRELLLEKAPGRPNQFQYVLENAHHLALGKFGAPKDEFSQGLERLATRIRDGYSLVAQLGAITVLEKPAEQTANETPCPEAACYELRTLNSHKRFGDSLTEAGTAGLQLRAVSWWQGMSVHAVIVFLARGSTDSTYEYRAVAQHDEGAVADLARQGFRISAQVSDVLVLERSPRGPHCEYRFISGLAEEVERELPKAVGEGFRPLLLFSEARGSFHRVISYSIIAEHSEESR